tara:strand:+ start:4402 stop:4623 length:222 start_codon:yes stop_codon:yes gene_type:complete
MTEEFLQNSIKEVEVSLESIEEHYHHLKVLLESMESDVVKSQKGNKSAGVRLRKSLRLLKGNTGDFIKFTLGK